MEKKEEVINLSYIMKTLFVERGKYRDLTIEDKEKWGFIVNRYLSKRYPEYAQLLNVRSGDFSMVLDFWWIYLKSHPDKYYNRWIWETKSNKKSDIDSKIIKLIQKRHPTMTVSDIEYMAKWYPETFEEDVKYYQQLEKDYG